MPSSASPVEVAPGPHRGSRPIRPPAQAPDRTACVRDTSSTSGSPVISSTPGRRTSHTPSNNRTPTATVSPPMRTATTTATLPDRYTAPTARRREPAPPSAAVRQPNKLGSANRPAPRSLPTRASALRSAAPRAAPFPTIVDQTATQSTLGRTNARANEEMPRSSGPAGPSSDSRAPNGSGYSSAFLPTANIGHSSGDNTSLYVGTSPRCPVLYDSASDSPSEDEIESIAPTLSAKLVPPNGPATSIHLSGSGIASPTRHHTAIPPATPLHTMAHICPLSILILCRSSMHHFNRIRTSRALVTTSVPPRQMRRTTAAHTETTAKAQSCQRPTVSLLPPRLRAPTRQAHLGPRPQTPTSRLLTPNGEKPFRRNSKPGSTERPLPESN